MVLSNNIEKLPSDISKDRLKLVSRVSARTKPNIKGVSGNIALRNKYTSIPTKSIIQTSKKL